METLEPLGCGKYARNKVVKIKLLKNVILLGKLSFDWSVVGGTTDFLQLTFSLLGVLTS